MILLVPSPKRRRHRHRKRPITGPRPERGTLGVGGKIPTELGRHWSIMIELFVLATEKSHWTRTDSEGHLHDSKLWRNSCGCVWRPREVRRGCDYPRRRSRIRLYRERDRRRKSVKKSRSPSAPSERKAPRRPRTMQVLLSPSLLSHTTMTQSVTNWADQSSRNQWSHASSPPKNWSKRMDETRDPIAIFCFDFFPPSKEEEMRHQRVTI